ncbi:MAG TPA: ABATE domain-containing protein [Dongiaceae bacterium]|nr:ABATE domain-containing protein [Dongiaceae bacterium]
MSKPQETVQAPFGNMAIETGHVWGPLDFVGGLACLNFTNTAGGHTKIREVERIPTYGDVINWGLHAELISPEEARALLALAKSKPKDAFHRVRELQVFRESLHRLVTAIAHKEAPQRADFARVRGAIAKALSAADMRPGETEFDWSADARMLGLGTVIARVALSTHHMLSREKPSQLRQCEVCTWLFIDRTKNQKRRFCRQDACGNKSRAERFYSRKRKATADTV